jgi:hypothetical protein
VQLDVDGRPAEGRVPALGHHRQHHDQAAQRLHLGGDARAREVGTDGKLGGQAQVREVTGVWKDLTESVNSMASNLTRRSATSPT